MKTAETFIDVYKKYELWWYEWGHKGEPETTFEQHINSMTLYEFMELLRYWED